MFLVIVADSGDHLILDLISLKTNLKVTDPEKYATWETEHYWGECDSNFNGNILSVKNTCALFCKLSNFTLSKMNSDGHLPKAQEYLALNISNVGAELFVYV